MVGWLEVNDNRRITTHKLVVSQVHRYKETVLPELDLRSYIQGNSSTLEHELEEVILDIDLVLQYVEFYRDLRNYKYSFDMEGMRINGGQRDYSGIVKGHL